jgi:hypothetical protein
MRQVTAPRADRNAVDAAKSATSREHADRHALRAQQRRVRRRVKPPPRGSNDGAANGR